MLNETAIEKLLVDDWASGLRITTVPQAMGRLGFEDDPEARWRMVDRLYGLWQSSLETPEKVQEIASAIGLKNSSEREALSHRWLDQVGTWGRAPILLTDNKKLMARHMWSRRLKGQPLIGPEDTAASLGISTKEVNNGTQLLSRLGFISLQRNPPRGGYSLAEDADKFLGGLGFFYHTVTLDGQENFGLP